MMKPSTLIVSDALNVFIETDAVHSHVVDEDPLGIVILLANNGNGRWWCTMCNATTMGTTLSFGNDEGGRLKTVRELIRLAHGHLQRVHRQARR